MFSWCLSFLGYCFSPFDTSVSCLDFREMSSISLACCLLAVLLLPMLLNAHPPISGADGGSCPYHTADVGEEEAMSTTPSPPDATPSPSSEDSTEQSEQKTLEDLPVISLAELESHGSDAESIYISIVGLVFDVTKKGKVFYGPNGGYKFFSGIEGTRKFAQGTKFSLRTPYLPSADDDVDLLTLDASKLNSLRHWLSTFLRKYELVAKVGGDFYHDDGNFAYLLDSPSLLPSISSLTHLSFPFRYPSCS